MLTRAAAVGNAGGAVAGVDEGGHGRRGHRGQYDGHVAAARLQVSLVSPSKLKRVAVPPGQANGRIQSGLPYR